MNVCKQEEWDKDISGGWERWERGVMRLIDSPYNACRAVMWDRIVALVDILSIKNPFGWQKVLVNLPVTTAYDCQRLWVYKEIRDGMIAANFLCMWMMGNLFDLQKKIVGKRL